MLSPHNLHGSNFTHPSALLEDFVTAGRVLHAGDRSHTQFVCAQEQTQVQ